MIDSIQNFPLFSGQYAFLARFAGLIVLAAIWSIVWKGLALWRAGRQGSKVWFVILLIVNTLGILEILYLYVFSKKSGPAQNL